MSVKIRVVISLINPDGTEEVLDTQEDVAQSYGQLSCIAEDAVNNAQCILEEKTIEGQVTYKIQSGGNR